MCLRRGYRLNLPDHHSTTPLHFAALGDAADAAEILLSAGADSNARNGVNGRGLVPLVWSLARGAGGAWTPGSFAVAKSLLQHGAIPNAISINRESHEKPSELCHRTSFKSKRSSLC